MICMHAEEEIKGTVIEESSRRKERCNNAI